jgi:hypothetical protein
LNVTLDVKDRNVPESPRGNGRPEWSRRGD